MGGLFELVGLVAWVGGFFGLVGLVGGGRLKSRRVALLGSSGRRILSVTFGGHGSVVRVGRLRSVREKKLRGVTPCAESCVRESSTEKTPRKNLRMALQVTSG